MTRSTRHRPVAASFPYVKGVYLASVRQALMDRAINRAPSERTIRSWVTSTRAPASRRR
jgi:hypothetical protein